MGPDATSFRLELANPWSPAPLAFTWRRFGAGPPLVLIHGGHGNWTHWIRNLEALGERHTLWVPDLPGYGDSATLPPEAGFEDIAAATCLALDELVGAKAAVDIAGFSFGGAVAAQIAVTRGARRIALLGTAGHGSERRLGASLVSWKKLPEEARREAFRHNLAALMIHDPAAIDALALESYMEACKATHFVSRPISSALRLAPLLSPWRGPALFLWGEHDVTATPAVAAQTLIDGRPEREAAVIPGAGHWVQYEAAGAVNERLLEWFA